MDFGLPALFTLDSLPLLGRCGWRTVGCAERIYKKSSSHNRLSGNDWCGIPG